MLHFQGLHSELPQEPGLPHHPPDLLWMLSRHYLQQKPLEGKQRYMQPEAPQLTDTPSL